MFALGQHTGRQAAHDIVYECAMQSYESDVAFVDVLLADKRVTQHVAESTLRNLLDPTQYTGLAAVFVDNVIKKNSER